MELQPRGQRAAPWRSWAAGPQVSPGLSSRFHGKSCLGCLGVCPGGSRHIWGMGPGQRGAWPRGPRMKKVHSHWPSSSCLSGSPFVHPGLEDRETIHHCPSFTGKGAEGGAWEAGQSCPAVAPARWCSKALGLCRGGGRWTAFFGGEGAYFDLLLLAGC